MSRLFLHLFISRSEVHAFYCSQIRVCFLLVSLLEDVRQTLFQFLSIVIFAVQGAHLHEILVQVVSGRRLPQLLSLPLIDRRVHEYLIELFAHIFEVLDRLQGRLLHLCTLDAKVVHSETFRKVCRINLSSGLVLDVSLMKFIGSHLVNLLVDLFQSLLLLCNQLLLGLLWCILNVVVNLIFTQHVLEFVHLLGDLRNNPWLLYFCCFFLCLYLVRVIYKVYLKSSLLFNAQVLFGGRRKLDRRVLHFHT